MDTETVPFTFDSLPRRASLEGEIEIPSITQQSEAAVVAEDVSAQFHTQSHADDSFLQRRSSPDVASVTSGASHTDTEIVNMNVLATAIVAAQALNSMTEF